MERVKNASPQETTVIENWRTFKRQRCAKAREELIDHYRYLIPKTRQRIIPSVPVKVDVGDLEQEGIIALIKALDNFEPWRDVKFTSYAISMIRGAMLEFLRNEDWIPRSIRTCQKQLNRAEEALELDLDGPVTDEDRADYLDLGLDEFYELQAKGTVKPCISLEDLTQSSEQDELDPLVVQASVRSADPAPHDSTITREKCRLLYEWLGELPQQLWFVVERYYFAGLTLKQIAVEVDRSESRVHQCHSKAIEEIRKKVTGQARDPANPSAERHVLEQYHLFAEVITPASARHYRRNAKAAGQTEGQEKERNMPQNGATVSSNGHGGLNGHGTLTGREGEQRERTIPVPTPPNSNDPFTDREDDQTPITLDTWSIQLAITCQWVATIGMGHISYAEIARRSGLQRTRVKGATVNALEDYKIIEIRENTILRGTQDTIRLRGNGEEISILPNLFGRGFTLRTGEVYRLSELVAAIPSSVTGYPPNTGQVVTLPVRPLEPALMPTPLPLPQPHGDSPAINPTVEELLQRFLPTTTGTTDIATLVARYEERIGDYQQLQTLLDLASQEAGQRVTTLQEQLAQLRPALTIATAPIL